MDNFSFAIEIEPKSFFTIGSDITRARVARTLSLVAVGALGGHTGRGEARAAARTHARTVPVRIL